MTVRESILKSCTLLLGLYLQVAKTELHVELVQVLFRHGHRTPRAMEMYPNDPHNVSTYEPMGLGQLSNQGKMTEYLIGKMLRERYNDFLGDIYRPTDVYAVTTDIDRTKMSLQLVLAGLYPPSAEQTWNTDLLWMPIPGHYMPEKIDILMKGHMCPIYEKALKDVRNSEEVRKKVWEYKELFDFLTQKTGMEIVDSSQVYEIYHLLSAQKGMNLSMPEWCTDDVYKRMEEVTILDYEIRSYTPQLKRLHTGALIKKWIQNVHVNQEREKPRKIYLYSAHEVNIAAYSKAHNFTVPKVPDYGSAFVFETLRDDDDKRYVRILFWTGRTEVLYTFNLMDDKEICPIEKYIDMVKEIMPLEEEENCFWDSITKEDLQKLYEETSQVN